MSPPAGRGPDWPSLGQDLVLHSSGTLRFSFMARAIGVITCWWNYPLEDPLPFLECRDRICLVQNEAWHLEMLTNTSSLRECMDGRTDGRTDGWTDGQMV